MRSLTALLLACFTCVFAADRPMTLRQAVETALKQNSDVMLARLDVEKARQALRLAKAPFYPRVTVGSGLAYTYGFPMSIEGSAPSVLQANAVAEIFNRPQTLAVAQAKEDAHGAALSAESKQSEVAYRTASLYLDAGRAVRIGALARKDAASLQEVLGAIQAQVAEGRALPLAEKQAAYNVARASQLADGYDDDGAAAETSLAIALGMSAEDRVIPADQDMPAFTLPGDEESAIRAALQGNLEVKQIDSQIASKELELRSGRAARLPRADLVAQYGMLAEFNNYSEYFQRFQRNNGQLGVSLQLPLFSPGVGAQSARDSADIDRLRIQRQDALNRIRADIQSSYRDVKKAATAADVARLDLEVAREQLSVDLAQMQEGRATMRQVEESRIVENDKWIAFYDAQYAIDRARWNLLRLTGQLTASIEALP
ncbi:MAG TPA: TolC family protein [Bryobacteraceae bacterium]|nr:TolC family protein [Bryobacteraceae bacterium]